MSKKSEWHNSLKTVYWEQFFAGLIDNKPKHIIAGEAKNP
jgi:hypothetical protein